MLNQQQVANPVLNQEMGKSLLHIVASEDHVEKVSVSNHGNTGSIQLVMSPELIKFQTVGLSLDHTRKETILYHDPDGIKGCINAIGKRVLTFGKKWHQYNFEELCGTATQHLTIKSKDKNQLVLNGLFNTSINIINKEKKGNKEMTQENAIPAPNKSMEQDSKPKSGIDILKDILNYKLIQGGNASKNYQALPPKYINKLLDEKYFKTFTELADALGVSGSVVSTGVKQGRISSSIELGARAIYIGKYFAAGGFENDSLTVVDHLTEINKAVKHGLKLNVRDDGILGVEQRQYYYPGE